MVYYFIIMREKRLVNFGGKIQAGYNPEKEKFNFYLSDILTDDKHYKPMIMNNCITVLNKAECGNGGTTSIIEFIRRSNRGCLFLVPNVSIVKSKAEKYKDDPDICCVWGGITDINYSAKIVIATYDQFKRLLENIKYDGTTEGKDVFSSPFWVGRCIFVDEYHKLVDDQYREVMAEITNLIITTVSAVSLISATPNDEFIDVLEDAVGDKKDIIRFDVEYDLYPPVKEISVYEMKQGKLRGYLKGIIDSGKKYCVFINNISVVSDVVHNEGVEDCEILCSEENRDTAGEYYSDTFNENKRVHFMTSAYFTGHDIEVSDIYKVVIIGGRSGEAMALSMRDIKQILGRFRHYCCLHIDPEQDNPYNTDKGKMDNIVMIYLGEKINIASHNNIKDGIAETADLLEPMGDNWKMTIGGIRTKLYNMYYTDTLKRLNIWMKEKTLLAALKAEGYVVNAILDKKGNYEKAYPVEEIPDYTPVKMMAYADAYKKIKNGEDITRKDYRYAPDIKKYFEIEGIPEVMPTREELLNIVRVGKKIIKKEEIKKFSILTLTSEERYDVFEFKDGFRYRARRLLDTIKYVKKHYPSLLSECDKLFGDEKLTYHLLPFYMKEVFGCMTVREKGKTNKICGSQDEWRVMRCNLYKYSNFTENSKNEFFSGHLSYIEKCPQNIQKLEESVKSIKISYLIGWNETQKSNVGRTIYLKDIRRYMENPDRPLVGKYRWCYDWVNETDKAKRLKEKKETEDWKYIKMKWQMLFSELYRETDNIYGHHKAECDTISSLIVDIDSGFRFNQFCEMYKNYTWFAYPTISNTDPDNWHKFRVIVPLAQPVKLEGENNLKVLKALRQSFCVFEDPCHNLGSYINQYDFAEMYINEGNLYSVSQNDVDVIQRIYKIKGSYVSASTKAEDEKKMSDATSGNKEYWINRTIEEFNNCYKNRNDTIFSRLAFLIGRLGFGSAEIDQIRVGLRSDMRVVMDHEVLRNHREWNVA